MKKLSVLFVLLCLPTFAFGDVCSLSFRGGYKTEKEVVIATWYDDGKVLLRDASDDVVPVNGDFLYAYDYKDVFLDKLESVNGKHISVPNFLPGNAVFFNCDKWQNGEYFAYSCGIGFQGVNKVDVYYGLDMYDECIKSVNEEAEENDDIDVFAKIDVDLIKYFSKSSVWTKEDGSFNTARLASDSIAGVVLGTVGGVVTSKIIKKNQVKKGFEDLKCTIAGQTVATYGDDFQVGIDR